MTREEFLELGGQLVGTEFGMQARLARVLGVSYGHLGHVCTGRRPVPEAYAQRLREAVERGVEGRPGQWVQFVGPDVEKAIKRAERAGCPRGVAVHAIIGWLAPDLQAQATAPRRRG